jgi:hypothetical protein
VIEADFMNLDDDDDDYGEIDSKMKAQTKHIGTSLEISGSVEVES